MNDNEMKAMLKVVEILKGKTMSFLSLDTKERKDIKITDVQVKDSGNLIFESDDCFVGYFCPMQMFSIVKRQTGNGWEGGEILDEVTIGEIPFGHFMASIITVCS
jgi:hypothetical protein